MGTRFLGLSAFALLVLGAQSSCTSDTPDRSTPTDPRTALDYDVRDWYRGTYTVTYRVEVDQPGGSDWQVTWYKDGIERQRFDISGSGFPLDDLGRVNVFIPGDRTKTTLCVADGGALATQLKGDSICCEGDSAMCGDAGDTAANIVYGELNFLLEYPESGLDASAVGLSTGVNFAPDRHLAGMRARCYTFTYEQAPDAATDGPELCFGDDGVELYRSGAAPFGSATLTAVSASTTVSNDDFDYPYRLIADE